MIFSLCLYIVQLSFFIYVFSNYSFLTFIFVAIGAYLVKKSFHKMFGLTPLEGIEVMTFSKSPCNMVIGTFVIILEKITPEDVKFLINKMCNSPGCEKSRKKVVQILGNLYWKYDSNFSIDKHFSILDPNLIHSVQDMSDFVCEESLKECEENKSPWHAYMVEEYAGDPTKSIIFLKVHHSIGDGISGLHVFFRLDDNPPPPMFKLFNFSWKQKLLIYTLMPFLGIGYLWNWIFGKNDLNCLTSKRPLSGKRKGKLSQQFNLNQIKQVSKLQKMTINDFVLTSISEGLADYIAKYYSADQIPEAIKMGVPFSVREVPKDGIVPMNNRFTLVTLKVPMRHVKTEEDHSAFSNQIISITKKMRESFSSLIQIKFGFVVAEMVPHSILVHFSHIIGSKHTLFFSNVAGPASHLTFKNSRVIDYFSFVPTFGRNSIGIVVFSYDDHIEFSIWSDVNCMKDPENLVKLIENRINSHIMKLN